MTPGHRIIVNYGETALPEGKAGGGDGGCRRGAGDSSTTVKRICRREKPDGGNGGSRNRDAGDSSTTVKRLCRRKKPVAEMADAAGVAENRQLR